MFIGVPPIYNTKCTRTGDYLCDTDADPRDGGSTCTYTGNQKDVFGQLFHPDTYNYMSYYTCRSRFSPQQKAIIANSMRKWMYTLNGALTDPDQYEPDDPDATVVGTPKQILIDETQCHSKHNSIVKESCDDSEDWLKIENENGFIDMYKITLEDVSGEKNPVKDVRIWNTNASGARTNEKSIWNLT